MKKMKRFKKNKKLLSFNMVILIVLFPLWGISQQLTPVLTATAGGSFDNGTFSVDFSAGEPVTGLFTGNGIMLYQGFQQGTLNSTGIEESLPIVNKITLYPNPVTVKLFAKSKTNSFDGTYCIKNMQGQILLSGKISQITKGIDLEDLNAGTYFITFYEKGQHPVNKIFIKQ